MFAKLVRLGKDAELRSLNNGDKVASLAMVYDVGYGANKRSQWIEGTLWGKRAESLAEYLTKGSQIVLYADDVELETYPKNDGSTGSKLKCRVNDISLISGQSSQTVGGGQGGQQSQQPQQQQQPPHSQGNYQQQQEARQAMQQPHQPGGFVDNFDDDIPF